MTIDTANGGKWAYDPRGIVEAEPKFLAPRRKSLDGLRVAVLDNSKWNAGALLRGTATLLGEQNHFTEVNYYVKESFSLSATPEMLDEIAAHNDVALIAIGD